MNIEERKGVHKPVEYIYLVERKRDKEKFVMYGNFKTSWMRVSALYRFVSENAMYGQKTPFGRVSHISSDEKYDSKRYRVVHQIVKTAAV